MGQGCNGTCKSNERCIDGKCVPTNDGTGNVCAVSSQCGSNKKCVDGYCVDRNATGNTGGDGCGGTCKPDETCKEGTCVKQGDGTCPGGCGDKAVCREGVCVPVNPVEEDPPEEEDGTTPFDSDGDGQSDIYQKWANETDRAAAYRLYLAQSLGIDLGAIDSDYNDWLEGQFDRYDMLYRQAIGANFRDNAGTVVDEEDVEDEVDDGNGGKRTRRRRRRRRQDGSVTEVELDENGNPVGEEVTIKPPVNPDYMKFLGDHVTADEIGKQGNRYQDFWANRNQRTYYLNQLQGRGLDTGGYGTQNEYQQWLTGEAFRPYEEGFQQARNTDPNLQFRAYLSRQLGGADLTQEGDTYQDYWGDRNQAAKFTNWARAQGYGQIDNAHNPFTSYIQGEGGMGKLQRAWNQDTGGSTWNDFLKTQDPSQFVNNFLRAGRSKQGKAGNAFGAGPGRWSTFG